MSSKQTKGLNISIKGNDDTFTTNSIYDSEYRTPDEYIPEGRLEINTTSAQSALDIYRIIIDEDKENAFNEYLVESKATEKRRRILELNRRMSIAGRK